MNNPAKLYIVRHGETEMNVKGLWQGHHDSPLTENGLQQAQGLGEKLKDIEFAAAFSSDLLRAKRTAEMVKLERKIEIKATELLRERSFGVFEGKSIDQLGEEYKEMVEEYKSLSGYERYKFTFGGLLEGYDKMILRFTSFLREISLAYPNQNVLVVTHGGITRSFLGSLDPDLWHYRVGNTAYAIVLCDGSEFELVETNGLIDQRIIR
jgi:probable phosphoglycerate mutase